MCLLLRKVSERVGQSRLLLTTRASTSTSTCLLSLRFSFATDYSARCTSRPAWRHSVVCALK